MVLCAWYANIKIKNSSEGELWVKRDLEEKNLVVGTFGVGGAREMSMGS